MGERMRGQEPESSREIAERGRGQSERTILGRSPAASVARIAGFVLAFIVLGGTVFYFALQS